MSSQAPQLSHLLEVAESAARAAGTVALRGFRGPMEVRSKGGKDIVTEYDTAAEEAAIGVIRGEFPDHAVLAEESGISAGALTSSSAYTWAVDPIDGTHNYAAQLPFWCTSVAVGETGGKIVAGAIFDPLHDELFTATLGGGAHLNGSRIHVSATRTLGDAFLATDIGYGADIAHRMMSLAPYVQPRVKRLRLLGSAVLALAYVAAGRFDAYYHLSLQTWDMAAAALLVSEAGGAMTDWDGNDLGDIRMGLGNAVAANVILQPQVLALLRVGEMGDVQ